MEESEASEESEEEEEFFVSKKNQREIGSDGEEKESSSEEEEVIKRDLKVNKKKLRKITKDGPFQGKNKVYFDAEGKPISSLQHHLLTKKA